MRRFATWLQAFSVRYKVLGLAVGVTVLMGMGSVVVARGALLAASRAELEQHAVAVANAVAARSLDSVLTHSSFSLYQLLTSVRDGDSDVRYIFVVDGRGQVVGHTFGEGFPTDLLRLPQPESSQPSLVTPLETEEGLVHDAAVLLPGGQFGFVRVGLSEERLQMAARDLWAGMIQTLIAAAAVAVIAALLLSEFLTRPLRPLIAVTRAVAVGDLTRKVPPGPPDEFGQLSEAFNHMVAALWTTHSELRAKEQVREDLLKRVITAQEDERRRISRELHDEAGQSLTGLMVGLRSLSQECPTAAPQAEELRQLAHETLDRLRHLSRELRPSVLDDLGLPDALRRYANDYSAQHGLHVDLQIVGDPAVRVPNALETCLYRIAQEALTNAARHARAKHVSLILTLRPEVVSLIVEDDGVGFAATEVVGQVSPDGKGLGIYGMQERATLVGGTVQIESSPGNGTSVFVKCPIIPEGGSACGTAAHSVS